MDSGGELLMDLTSLNDPLCCSALRRFPMLTANLFCKSENSVVTHVPLPGSLSMVAVRLTSLTRCRILFDPRHPGAVPTGSKLNPEHVSVKCASRATVAGF